ncbi:hypothetical protein LC608_34935 [Nostoc sp. XA010]|uniref:HMA2 domain-containing protein n=1 Tax=Nostoc sp. XA010 TaxID=2780407 RepID=UPI001E4565F1|nr:hypothetical protein [Nostoc sp. XA010]MCC5662020.1 hypothetical protein [Nostoc sp. XA010]
MAKIISNHEKLSASGKISSDSISTQQSNRTKHITPKAITLVTQSQLSGALQIVHVTTGRVRLRTTDSSLNLILDNIAQDLRSIEEVREVAVNEQTGSLVVNFDEDKLSLPQILALKSDLISNCRRLRLIHLARSIPLQLGNRLHFGRSRVFP